jgi:hypothetical protein
MQLRATISLLFLNCVRRVIAMRSRRSTVTACIVAGLVAIAAQTASVPICLGASIESEINAIWEETLKLYEAARYEEAERVAKRGLERATATLGASHARSLAHVCLRR